MLQLVGIVCGGKNRYTCRQEIKSAQFLKHSDFTTTYNAAQIPPLNSAEMCIKREWGKKKERKKENYFKKVKKKKKKVFDGAYICLKKKKKKKKKEKRKSQKARVIHQEIEKYPSLITEVKSNLFLACSLNFIFVALSRLISFSVLGTGQKITKPYQCETSGVIGNLHNSRRFMWSLRLLMSYTSRQFATAC